MEEANRRQAVKKRGILKAGLSRIETFVNTELETSELALIQTKLNRLRSLNEEFQTIQLDLELSDESEDAQHEKYREEFEDLYDIVESKLQSAVNIITAANPEVDFGAPSVNDSCRKRNIRLPKINLPTFDGNLTTWVHYKDTFENLIIANEDLSNIERFHYLLASLAGEAKDTIKNISISDSNFTTAYNLIKGRYHCPKLIASEYIKQLLEPPSKSSSTEPELRRLINTFQGSLDALAALNAQPSIQDLLLTELLLSHVDRRLRLEFENTHANQDIIIFNDLVKFLEKKCQTLQLCTSASSPKQSHSSEQRKYQRHNEPTKQHQVYTSTTSPCCICSGSHKLHACPEFLHANISDKYKMVKDNNACSNCLSLSHKWKSCPSKMTCKQCKKYHHTLLHDESRNSSQTPHQYVSYHSVKTQPTNQVLLSTALVKIKDSCGRYHMVRAILDSGSQSNFISEKVVQQLHLKRHKTHTTLHSFGDLSSHSNATVGIEVHSNVNDYSFNIDCVVLPKITGNIPASHINWENWKVPKDIPLADPSFYKPQVTDLLIGAPVFMQLLKMERKTRPGNYPVLQSTHLGWIVSGSYHQPSPQGEVQTSQSFFLRNDLILENQIQKFWSIEEVNQVVYSSQEKECEKHFQENTTRDDYGRYTVGLPLKDDHKQLGNSREMAIQRFHLLERRLQRDKDLRQEYTDFMTEYEELGHMQQIQPAAMEDEEIHYYMPHHPVFKRTSTTTKTRVVFDASAKTGNGLSLNDILLVGPTIQDDLCSIILRFRTKPIAFTADIEKMYRQVNINPQNHHLQCILWRKDPKETLKTYTLTTVTYGTSAAPFLATRCLQQLAADEEKHFPRASIILKRDFYVDDCMSGADTIEEAQIIRSELQELLRCGGFTLRKWCTNSLELLNCIPTHLQENQHALTDDNSDIVKTLGLIWQPSKDTFQVVSDPIPCRLMNAPKVSKRFVLSRITAIFDPLGLLAPIVILCKIFMQRLWIEKAAWDDPLTSQLLHDWTTLSNQLQVIRRINIPRLVLVNGNVKSIQVHGFCDASEKAYGACIYLRSTNSEGQTTVMLLCAKSKVAPLKQITLPRLELCGAVLLARLLKKTLASLCLSVERVYLWTDSMLVLNWLASCPTRWKTFVANRVAEIQEITPVRTWYHVPTETNPADLVSRGQEPSSLINCDLWWHGPRWLKEDPAAWPYNKVSTSLRTLPEQRSVTVLIAVSHNDEFITRFSNLLRLQRVVAYCLRFISNCRKKSSERNSDPLSAGELDTALKKCIKITQALSYAKEITELKKDNELSSKSNIKNLNPILDQDECIRVGGRLLNAPLSYEARHQIILPAHHHLTKLIITNEHKRLLHASNHLLTSSLRQRFWIPTIRQIVRKCIHSCIVCKRLSATTAQQLMGNLPKERVTPSRPFTNVGIDYAGPILTKTGSKRSKTTSKSYIALFVCLSTKALHLEVTTDLSTNAFLASLRRFISRRGCPSRIYSDNGTNFVGANKNIQRLFMQNDHGQELMNATSSMGLTWHFIPPSAPHFGGLWEAAVKSVKYHLRRIMGNSSLTFEELTTLVTQIEACLNSRPLIKSNDDSTDPPYLTPAHFLIGEPLTALPEFDAVSQPINLISRWQYIQQLKQHFWQRWSKEYLNTLQQRQKWTKSSTNLCPGTVVLIKDDNLPPLRWNYGVIEAVHPGSDNRVRVATVRSNSTVLKRPIHKLCVLPTEE